MSLFVSRQKAGRQAAGHSEGKSLNQELWDWVKATLAALVVVVVIHRFGFQVSAVVGSSMQPTLADGEWLFINKAVKYLKRPTRGDVVILKEPDAKRDANQPVLQPYLVKRVVAIAGDRVAIRSGKLFVNGQEAIESYTDAEIAGEDADEIEIAPGYVFVLGDNRRYAASADSRKFGAVPVSDLQGRAEWILWPVSKAARL